MATLHKAALLAALAVPLVIGRPAHANTSTAFPSGSLILPTGSAFQDDCGAVSIYGLVYDVLRANTWLAAHGYNQIQIFYGYLDVKKSPNRCRPTNLSTSPVTTPACSGTCVADTSWNDGCDFQVNNATGTPVKLINNASHTTADTAVVTFDTRAKTNVQPGYPSQTIDATVSQVGYLGGPFVITQSEAATFMSLLDGTLIAQDSSGNNIDFSPFRTRSTGQTAPPTSGCTLGTDHYVYIHRAQVAFTVNVGLVFTNAPPRLALLASDNYGETSTINNNILQGYLKNAGLNFSTAGGTATGTTGQIYDTFDFSDLATVGRLAAPKYKMLWMPHWQSNASASSPPTATELTALSNISSFLDGQTGLAAECASVSSLEGSYNDEVGHASSAAANGNYKGLQLQTCVNNGSGGCSTTTTNWGINRDGYSLTSTGPNSLVNCSDITTATSSQCAYYSYPGDPFAQIGDHLWFTSPAYNASVVGGLSPYSWVWGFKPLNAKNDVYKPGVLPLVSGVSSLNRTNLTLAPTATAVRTMIVDDYATRNIKDNTAGKANILYLGGHDENSSVAATKLMLETLLQLGNPTIPPTTITTEISRSTPVTAMINGSTAVVQGTLEYVNPPQTPTTYSAAGATFTFPALHGHMRARTATSITSTASTYGSAGVIFDAAGGIPSTSASYTGCGTWYTGTCRTVFTTVTGGFNPAIHYLQSSELATIGPLMAPDLPTADQAILMQRVIAGDNSSGAYRATLGGVDRSTVAVIPSSSTVNATRPTMAYFGATDGMLHAVCASVAGNCDVLGRELWAFVPRKVLAVERYNIGRIDGSPRVIDAFGDFYGTGKRSYRTIMVFQTGSGDTTADNRVPAVYALDVSDPTQPHVLWEYSLASVAARGVYELGLGLTLSANQVPSGKYLAFVQTNNDGTGGAGNVVTAINMETGLVEWQTGYLFTSSPYLRSGGTSNPSATAVPGGAVGVYKTGTSFVTDLVFGTLYGDLWDVDPATGISKYGTGQPLLRFSTDMHPIGAPPAIYSKGGIQYAVIVTGGYTETYPNDSNWTTSTTANYALAVSLNTPVSDAIINENKGAPDIGFSITLASGDRGYAQATVVGNQVFVAADSADANNTSSAVYGLGGATGHVYSYDFGAGTAGTTVVVEGGVSAPVAAGTAIYVGSSDKTQQLASAATCANCGTTVDPSLVPKLARLLWLVTQ